MCGRITLTRPNLESIASELNVATEKIPRLSAEEETL
jgi:hypothetical protein